MKISHVFFLFVFIGTVFVFQSQLYRIFSKKEVSNELKGTLTNLGEQALGSNDVPVAAAIYYYDTLVSVGYNTVYRDGNLGGHAEINALSSAFVRFGKTFKNVKMERLEVFSTFEPCEMCKGALVQHGVKHVYFEQGKGIFEQAKSTINMSKYEWYKVQFNADSLQEKLFLQHPDYPKH